MKNIFKKLQDIMEEKFNSNHYLVGALDDEVRDILGMSFFYYSSDIDPTPIITFGADIPLYVYVDSFVSMREKTLNEATLTFYSNLNNYGFTLQKKHTFNVDFSIMQENSLTDAELTLWGTQSGKQFLLLFTKSDSANAYDIIYRDDDDGKNTNLILPRYIGNRRYENLGVNFLQFERSSLNQSLKRVEYIFGVCHNSKYRLVGEYKYYGRWLAKNDNKVKLYRRFYYYLH